MKRKKAVHAAHRRWFGFFVVIALGVLLAAGAVVAFVKGYQTTFCANSVSCIRDLTGEFQTGRNSTFMGRRVNLPPSLANLQKKPMRVLGEATAQKHIYVDLFTQTLTAYDGSKVVMSFPISSGRWHPTPTGDFRIWIKLRYTHMEGGDKADGTYYNLYNVPYTMFFYNDAVPKEAGFSLHGAYWHNNFGHPMSHGCVNIRPEDAGKLYDWADPVTSGSTTYATDDHPGTLVTITGQTPDE